MTREEELAALIAEQASDEQWGHLVAAPRVPHNMRALSLDYTFEGGGSVGEAIGVPDVALEVLIGGADTAVRRIPRPWKWTKRQIISAIRKWEKEHGEPPGYADWHPVNGRGIPSALSVRKHFGSWNNAIRAAGFEPHPIGGKRQPVRNRLRKRIERQHSVAYMTQAEIAAAYVLYDREGLGLPEIGRLLWKRYGYKSPRSCSTSLYRAFYQEGFRLRTRSEARLQRFTAEERKAISRKGGETKLANARQRAVAA